MEAEVHLVERWLQSKNYFTMTNVLAKGRKELDLIAVDASGKDRIHVEVRCASLFYLKVKQSLRADGSSMKNGVDYFVNEKFDHPNVKAKLEEIWGDLPYRKMLVVCRYDIDAFTTARNVGIELVMVNEILNELIEVVKVKHGQRDDVMRMLEFVYLGQKDRISTADIIEINRSREHQIGK